MASQTPKVATAFSKSENGTVAIIFALCAVALVLVTGLAIDVGRVMHANQKITGALDSAALAAAKGMRDQGLDDTAVKALAQNYFKANMDGTGANYATVTDFRVNIDRNLNSIALAVDADVPMLFAHVGGIHKIALPKSSVAVFERQDVEVALQLDVTGSMSGRKIRDLKEAVDQLLAILLPGQPSPNRTRIALAPFASGVNAGPYAKAITNGAATDGCVYERLDGADQATEVYPTGPDALKARTSFKSRPSDCPTDAQIMPLSEDRQLLSDTVNSWRTSTSTAGHLGTAWAWYLLSPMWATLWPNDARPAAYADGRTKKFAILMTDGIYNTFEGQMGRERLSSEAAIATCEAMRRQGIVVYTIGFEAPGPAKDTLRACASSPSKFFDAADGAQLIAAFRAIAAEIGSLRLSQ